MKTLETGVLINFTLSFPDDTTEEEMREVMFNTIKVQPSKGEVSFYEEVWR